MHVEQNGYVQLNQSTKNIPLKSNDFERELVLIVRGNGTTHGGWGPRGYHTHTHTQAQLTE